MDLPDLKSYETFLEENVLGFGLGKLEKYYESVVYPMKNTFEQSDFFKKLNENLKAFNDQFLMDNDYELMRGIKPLEIEIKPFDSMICKCYRKDIINNNMWKTNGFSWDAKYEWINPIYCFEKFTDILRTRISVRYLDGAIFISKKLKLLADSQNLSSSVSPKASEVGYYAIHFDLVFPFEITTIKLDPKEITSSIEFQINTEIQDLIINLAHKYYEQARMSLKGTKEIWQWDYECDEFLPNYLGHIIHYVEGMIMEVRKRK